MILCIMLVPSEVLSKFHVQHTHTHTYKKLILWYRVTMLQIAVAALGFILGMIGHAVIVTVK